MTSARITFATIFVLIASALTGQTQWKYRTTNDGEYHIGTNGPNVCVETNSISVTFTVPQGWRISEPKSDETGCKFTAGPASDLISFSYAIHRKLSADVFDPEFFEHSPHVTWAAREEDPFPLRDGRRLIPHHDTDDSYRPNRAVLYLFVPEGQYTCTFEFTGSRLLGLSPSRHIVQRILDTYVSTRRTRSDLKM